MEAVSAPGRGRPGAEEARLLEADRHAGDWKLWGPYLSERQWATVREDYSAGGECWDYFPHDHARSRAYRWGEDGLLGFCDRDCRLAWAVTLWNGRDPILKERLFGLTGNEGNHGEDAKEEWYYLDNTPTHAYAKALYKYPQAPFPYNLLVEENRRRTRVDPEFELVDTGAFHENRHFDVFVELAKRTPADLFFRITVINRGPEPALIHLLPTLWFRNTWSWGCPREGTDLKPAIALAGPAAARAMHEALGDYLWVLDNPPDEWLFTENETNFQRLFGVPNRGPYVKDGFHDRVVGGRKEAVNPAMAGTKAAAWFSRTLAPGEAWVLRSRVASAGEATVDLEASGPRARMTRIAGSPTFPDAGAVDRLFDARRLQADEFYGCRLPAGLAPEERTVARQAYAGLLWSKQFYHFVVADWLCGDGPPPPPPAERRRGRNHLWNHVYARDIFLMPDAWEYPWFAAWDLAFHAVACARLDGRLAKRQLSLLLREWYMHPNGQIPAYEFAFDDVNPPVHAWAAWRVYKMSGQRGARDRDFLESVFQKLLLNFTWWVNRKDSSGNNLFSGGFLGLDNIGVFDRSKPLPEGGVLQQADGTAWMAFYCATMVAIAVELAREGDRLRGAYEDMASKFLEHFVQIADAMNSLGGAGLWDEADGFYYDQIDVGGRQQPLRTRSLVGLLPLIAVEVLEETAIDRLPGFKKRLEWFVRHRSDLNKGVALGRSGSRKRLLLAIPTRERLRRVLQYLGDPDEFLSPHGLRSLSKRHGEQPSVVRLEGREYRVEYNPGESLSGLFGGNSNWRGPVWMPVNYLLIEALERYHHFYGPEFTVEYPSGSGRQRSLRQIAEDLEARLCSLFLPDATGRRPCHGDDLRYTQDPGWRSLVLFHEYFHGDSGKGLGASHQTGWTALVGLLLESIARRRAGPA